MLKTQRLNLVPLTSEQLHLLVHDVKALESELQCSYQGEPVEGFFKEILIEQQKICSNDPENYLWHTFWLIMRQSDGVVVGSVDFKNKPNEKGEVEIGYGLDKPFEKNGYMTETVEAMCRWALMHDNVTAVIAETLLDNLPSQRILERCGFVEYLRETSIWWRLDKI